VKKHVIIGRFGKRFGVRGWIKVVSFTHPLENILQYQPWLISESPTDISSAKKTQWHPVILEANKMHSDQPIVKIKDCNTPEAVSLYTNFNIAIPRERLPTAQEGEYYWTDLEGLKVIDKTGKMLGYLESHFSTPANDVMIVTNKDKKTEHFIPYLEEVVIVVDLKQKTITVNWDTD